MLVTAFALIGIPYMRSNKFKLTQLLPFLFSLIFVSSASLYYYVGSPESIIIKTTNQNIESIIESMENRVNEFPDDTSAWALLANSYTLQKDFSNAFYAFEQLISLENNNNDETLANYGESLVQSGDEDFLIKANELFALSLKINKYNTKSLFYGGITAISTGDADMAVARWKQLMTLSPPDDIKSTLQEKINEWSNNLDLENNVDSIFSIKVNINSELLSTLINYPNKQLFIIARDPENPIPPIAVIRKQVESNIYRLDDTNAMIPGTKLSKYKQLEFIARISLSGDPLDRSQNLASSVIINTVNNNIVLNIE
tara:strand:+ start:136 stop:1077 length:942 start_codon:yes stop_codon:yes gene_type:complete